MASITQNLVGIILGQQLYWRGAPVTFHGFITGTDCSLIMQTDNSFVHAVVTTTITTTPTG